MAEHYPPSKPAEYARGVSGWLGDRTFGLWHVLEGGRLVEDGSGERYARPYYRYVTLCGAAFRGRLKPETSTDPAPDERACAKCSRLLAVHECGSVSTGESS